MEITPDILKALPINLRAEIEENVVRKNLTQSEIAEIQRRLREEFSVQTKQGMRTDLTSANKFAEVGIGRVTEQVGKLFGESDRIVEKRLEIIDAAEKEPKKYQPLIDEMDKTDSVSGVHRRLKTMQKAELIEKEPPPLPEGPFRVIVIDPPWTFGNTESISNRSIPYPTMSIDEIINIDIQGIAADDCILWLWTTNTHLPQAFEIINTWDFEYKTMLIWVKDKIGLGYWLRSQTEPCLMATKGNPTVCLTNQSTVLEAHVREHSRKPDEFYEMVEILCPGSKVDLFAREKREGWITWGGEIGYESRYDK